MADIIRFPPADPPAPPPPSPDLVELREKWRPIVYAVQTIQGILDAATSLEDLSPDLRFEVEFDLEYLATVASDAAIRRALLPADEYRRRREKRMRALGLGHLL